MNKTVFKGWWGWNPSKIEDYLEDMALKGWRLSGVHLAMTIFDFNQDDPANVRYAFDYNNRPDDEYMGLIEDDGWVCTNKSAGWIMWKKEYSEERPHLLTDNQSLIDRNNRLFRLLLLLALCQIPILLMNFIDRDYSEHRLVSIIILCIYIPSLVILIFGLIRLFMANRAVKREGRR
ncbi:MAG TPA: hypothetical protein DCO79_10040 [Spirochaeta sp.]|nr:hypothetical protein [Spirochaeta sp.]